MADPTNISVSAIWISVSAISVSVLVPATLDIGSIGIGQISTKIHQYQPKYQHISAKIPVIGQILAKIPVIGQISAKLKYRYRWPICWFKYIGIDQNIGWKNISVLVSISAGAISVQP
jgi:hypothetical protein